MKCWSNKGKGSMHVPTICVRLAPYLRFFWIDFHILFPFHKLCCLFHHYHLFFMTSAKRGGIGGVLQLWNFADRGRVRVQKGPKYADVILEQPLNFLWYLHTSHTWHATIECITCLANIVRTNSRQQETRARRLVMIRRWQEPDVWSIWS